MTETMKTAWTRLTGFVVVGAAFAGMMIMMSDARTSLADPAGQSAQKTTMNIQTVTSPGGITAWLVESHNVPLIAMRFAFRGGAAQDPKGRDGTAYFLSGMLDEGAGDLKSTAFQERIEELAVRMSFDASRDSFVGNFQTLTKNRDDAFGLLKTALNKPRFDKTAVDRIRQQISTSLRFDAKDPDKIASREWFKLAFQKHPYARPLKGTEATLKKVDAKGLRSFKKKTFAQDNLTIAVVGDIDAKTLAGLLDEVFGTLPEKASLVDIPEAAPPAGPVEKVIEMNVPQSVAQFGHAGLKRDDKDFIPAYIMNYIFGGGGFSSRLMEEVREKRGLAYSVYTYLSPYRHAAIYLGGVGTKNQSIGKTMQVIRSELALMAKDGPTEKELKNAKQYLTGSYALRFDTSSKIANQLLWLQVENLGKDYITNRNDMINAVTLTDIKRVAARLIQADKLIVTIVGKPGKPPA